MDDIRQALAELHCIRNQVARVTEFRGYGPASIAFSGILALLVAAAETRFLRRHAQVDLISLGVWFATAAVSVSLAAVETCVRARRVHFGLAQEMVLAALEQFLPALIVGFLLTVILLRAAPNEFWMLPGLWELIFSLGIFASCRFLPRQMFAVGVWYMAAGFCSLWVASATRTFVPWTMGVPFGVGQLLVAVVLKFCFEDHLEQA